MKFLTTVFTVLFALSIYAQSEGISSVLQEIESNNTELIALKSRIESDQATLESGNNLRDPQLGTYYLPFGNNDANYFEIEVSQTFDFPSVYSARGDVITARQQELSHSYRLRRQEILLEAKKLCLDLIHLNKLGEVINLRVQQAQIVYEQVETLFDREQVGILEMNKAKVVWLQEQFKEKQIVIRKRNVRLLLDQLNGGNPVDLDQREFSSTLALPTFDTLLDATLSLDPEIQILNFRQEVAFMEYRLSKKQKLPDLTAGFNYQGVRETNHAGIYAGITIPLWSNRHKEEAAMKRHIFTQVNQEYYISRVEAETLRRVEEYSALLENFAEYRQTLSGLNSDELLFRSYELGEITYTMYYNEQTFFREAFDRMLEMELTLHKQKAELLKYQL